MEKPLEELVKRKRLFSDISGPSLIFNDWPAPPPSVPSALDRGGAASKKSPERLTAKKN